MKNRLPLFYTVTAIFWFALYTYVPYVSPYSELLGADLRLIGLIVGAYGFTQMLIRFPLGILSDRLGRRKIFVLSGLFFAALSGIVVYVVPHQYTMLLSRSLGGVAAASWVAFAILGASYYPADQATKSVGYLNAANAVGRMAAFLLGGLAGLVGLVAGLGTVEARDTNTNPPTMRDLFGLVKNRQLLSASLLAILSMYISFATSFGFTPLFAYGLDVSQFELGLLGMTTAIPALVFSPLAGTVLPRKIGARNTIAVGFIIAAIGCALIPLCVNIWQLYAVQFLISTGLALSYTMLMGLSIKDIPGERRATAMGFFQAVYGLGMFMGPFVTGWIAHGLGLNAAFVVTGAIGLMGAVAVVVFAKRGYIAR